MDMILTKVHEYEHQKGKIKNVAFSKINGLLATSGDGGSIIIYEEKVITKQVKNKGEPTKTISETVFEKKSELEIKESISCLEFLNNEKGKLITTSHIGTEKKIRIWNLSEKTIKPKTVRDYLFFVRTHPKEAIFFTGSLNDIITVYDTDFKELARFNIRIKYKTEILEAKWNNFNYDEILISTPSGEVIILNYKTQEVKDILRGHMSGVYSMVQSKDTLFLGSTDSTISFWNSDNISLRNRSFTDSSISCLSVNKRLLGFAGAEGHSNCYYFMDLETNKLIHKFSTSYPIKSFSFHPSKKIFACSQNNRLRIYSYEIVKNKKTKTQKKK